MKNETQEGTLSATLVQITSAEMHRLLKEVTTKRAPPHSTAELEELYSLAQGKGISFANFMK